jgi:hypothetical protein
MFDTAIGGDQICSATQPAELPQNARQDQPGWVARNGLFGFQRGVIVAGRSQLGRPA